MRRSLWALLKTKRRGNKDVFINKVIANSNLLVAFVCETVVLWHILLIGLQIESTAYQILLFLAFTFQIALTCSANAQNINVMLTLHLASRGNLAATQTLRAASPRQLILLST